MMGRRVQKKTLGWERTVLKKNQQPEPRIKRPTGSSTARKVFFLPLHGHQAANVAHIIRASGGYCVELLQSDEREKRNRHLCYYPRHRRRVSR